MKKRKEKPAFFNVLPLKKCAGGRASPHPSSRSCRPGGRYLRCCRPRAVRGRLEKRQLLWLDLLTRFSILSRRLSSSSQYTLASLDVSSISAEALLFTAASWIRDSIA
ncbi:hypothetical protein NPIL_287781 [Nephila pilipes]|uniref:Uncharacterized protein n=1 Tax=Nephila pilipes TaxID=299642 RepID=A0A8X6TLK4_NEPPI|nr:hypothetical protein NPIL_287781 [Nephila pilipes]